MEIRSFEYKMRDYNFAVLNDRYLLYPKKGKWILWDEETDIDEVVQLTDPKVKKLIEELETLEMELDGGRGAKGSNQHTYTWENGGKGEKEENHPDYPARMNHAIKHKSVESAIMTFRAHHGKADKEHAISVDSQGFVHHYVHGGKNAIRIANGKGGIVIQNHPNNSTFSPQDLISTAVGRGKGVVATHSNGYRMLTKGTHFDGVGLVKAIKRAQKTGVRGKNFNDAVDNFLRRNQKKYGYKFVHVRDTKATTKALEDMRASISPKKGTRRNPLNISPKTNKLVASGKRSSTKASAAPSVRLPAGRPPIIKIPTLTPKKTNILKPSKKTPYDPLSPFPGLKVYSEKTLPGKKPKKYN